MTIHVKEHFDGMAKNLGIEPGRLWSEILASQAAGFLTVAPDSDVVPEAQRGLAYLSQFVAGQGNVSDVPQAMKGSLFGLLARMEVREIAPERTSRRPAIEGFPEALFDWITALRTSKSGLLEKARASTDRQQFLLGHILSWRAVVTELGDAEGALLRDLAGYEREAVDLLRNDYGLVRAAVQSDRELRRALERVEAYLFGPAQQAVETRARTTEAGRTVAEKLLSSEHARGVSDGEQRTMEKLSAAIVSEGEPERDRRDPRSSGR